MWNTSLSAPVGMLHIPFVLMSIFMLWAAGPVKCHFQLRKASHLFGRGLLVRESLEWSPEGARGEHGKTTPSLAAFLLKPQCEISSMRLVLLGLGVCATSNPGKSCLATVSCPQAARSCLWCSALMMEILPSCVLGALCVYPAGYMLCA